MATKEAPKEKEIEKPYNPMADMVSVTLPRATGNEQNFEIVALNGKVWKIMRGVPVSVPRPVYDILSESLRMEDRLRDFNQAHEDRAGR